MNASQLRRFMNLWPPFLFSGIRVTAISADFRHVRVELRQRWYNRNYVGTHFGFPNMLVPFFTTDPEHLNNMKALLHKMTDGRGSRIILFGEPYPAFNTFRDPLPPGGHALTDSYDRVGYPSFNFLQA